MSVGDGCMLIFVSIGADFGKNWGIFMENQDLFSNFS
jgi:hypothetical protein